MSPASYTIFLERPSMVNGKLYSSSDSVDALTCNMTKQLPSQTSTESPRTAVTLRRPSVGLNYSLVIVPDDQSWNSRLTSCVVSPFVRLPGGKKKGQKLSLPLERRWRKDCRNAHAEFLGTAGRYWARRGSDHSDFVKRDRLLEMNRANHARLAGGIPQPPPF